VRQRAHKYATIARLQGEMWDAQRAHAKTDVVPEGRGCAPESSRGFTGDLPRCGRPPVPFGSQFAGTPTAEEIDAELAATQPVLSRTGRQAEQATFLQRISANREVDLIFKRDLHCVNPK
jgi:hypothetical protein